MQSPVTKRTGEVKQKLRELAAAREEKKRGQQVAS
jgi:hypothetical protein